MIISMHSDRLDAIFLGGQPENEGFEFKRMGDYPPTLPPREPDGARLVYAVGPTAVGGFFEELLITPPFGPKAFPSKEVEPLVNQGLAEMAELKKDTPHPFTIMRNIVVDACVERGYEVLAGLVIYRSTAGEPVHLSFHAKPLGEVVFTMRDAVLEVESGKEAADQETGETSRRLPIPEAARRNLLRPDRATLAHTGRLMATLLLPTAMKQPIDPYR